MSILSNKILNEPENICIDKTLPVISAPMNSLIPRTSFSPKRRLVNDVPVDRPTRFNTNYVPLIRFSDPETSFKKRNLNKSPNLLLQKLLISFLNQKEKLYLSIIFLQLTSLFLNLLHFRKMFKEEP
jgi:hypothetical protein